MYLFHNTTYTNLKSILRDGKLKASYYTYQTNEGFGIYDPKEQKYVFFGVVANYIQRPEIYADVILFFDHQLLFNRTFFVSTTHSASPEKLGSWGNNNYKRKYPQYYKFTKRILKALYNHSYKQLPSGKYFQAFQQVAIKNSCDLNKLVCIQFLKKPEKKLLSMIQKNYPHVQIIV